VSRNTDPSWSTVQTVRERDDYTCVLCFVRDALQTHHRRLRGMGGSKWAGINLPSNLITVCATCHKYIHDHVAWAKSEGLIVSHSADPAKVAVRLFRHGLVTLQSDGTRTALFPPNAALREESSHDPF
jgi:hypothetical protein